MTNLRNQIVLMAELLRQNAHDMGPSSIEFELATLQTVAIALADLDPAARARTLQWLWQRFELDVTSAPQVTESATTAVTLSPLRIVPALLTASDDALSVGSLGELFDVRRTPGLEPQSTTGRLSAFVAEFQQIAHEWDDACGPAADVVDASPPLSAAS